MDHMLMMLLVLLSSSGFRAEEIHNHSEPVRLVGGSSHCTGTLEVNHGGEWRPVYDSYWSLKEAAVICRELDCGSVVSIGHTEASSDMYSVWWIRSYCLQSGSALRDCVRSDFSTISLEITCSDSVRLVNGTSLCSGRLEVSNQSNKWWSSVCETDFDQQDAEVVCRELGCGAPSVLQGGLYGEVEGPMWTKEFQCGGHESALLDCRSSGSARNTCSPGKTVGLTCSEPVRLVGGSSRCAGTLEMKLGEWRPVHDWEHDWTLNEAAVFCRELDCGSAVSVGWRESSYRPVWRFSSDCVQSGSVLSDCVTPYSSSSILEITCSALLVQPNISVSSSMDGVSEAQQQGFQVIRGSTFTISCSIQPQYPGGSFQLIFTSSYSAHNYTQPAVNHSSHFLFPGADPTHQGSYSCVYHIYAFSHNFSSESHLLSLTVSDLLVEKMKRTRREPVRLVEGSSRCAGTLEVKHGREWRPVYDPYWTLKEAAVICRELDCGSVVSTGHKEASSDMYSVWKIKSDCVQSGSALRDCVRPGVSTISLEITCSDSVRLENGTSLCSGRLEVKSHQSNQWWSSVCEADFNQQDAEVVCRELGCGPPSVLQGGLYGEVEAPMWTKEFQCGGHESTLLDCRNSGSARNTCSPGKAVGLTCSAPVRLVGGSSRCAGTLEIKQGEWRPVRGSDWTLKEAAVFCRELDCGSALSTRWRKESSYRPMWGIKSDCVQSGSALRDCVTPISFFTFLEITCSDSVRLVNGTSLCSGRLEMKSNQSNQWWSSVCEADFDQQDAEVVCRELGCGAPSVLQGALYGEVEAPMWTKEFQCGGHESALLDCGSSGSARNSCSPGKAVGLTCSAPVRLVGGSSRCTGTLEVKQGEWRPVYDLNPNWTLKEAAVICTELDCGSAVSVGWRESSFRSVWGIRSACVQSGSVLRDCVTPYSSYSILEITCSGESISDRISDSNVSSVLLPLSQ